MAKEDEVRKSAVRCRRHDKIGARGVAPANGSFKRADKVGAACGKVPGEAPGRSVTLGVTVTFWVTSGQVLVEVVFGGMEY